MKPILIPVIIATYRPDNTTYEKRTRLFNPVHIVSVEPCPPLASHEQYPGATGGYIYTTDGRQHCIPFEAYHEAFVAIQSALTTP